MASETASGGTLGNWYRNRIGDPSTADEVRGYWVFSLGVILGVIGVILFFMSESAGEIRQLSIVLAASGLALLLAGPIIRLPLEGLATWLVYLGLVIAAAAIIWFVTAYPSGWSPQTGQLSIIGLYAVGVLIIVASGVFVPILSAREDLEAKMAAQESEIDDLEDSLAESEAREAELAADAAEHDERIAEMEADQASSAAQLGALQTSQAQFELYEDNGAQWRWRLRHRNGNILASSGQGYSRKNNAQNGMRAVRRDALGASVLLIESEEDLPAEGSATGFAFETDGESQATFELYEDEGDEYRWRLRHDNGNNIADGSQGYASREGAKTAIERIRTYVGPAEYLQPDPTAIEVYQDEGGKWRWRLRHKNGKLLASSGEGYADRPGVRTVIDRLRADMADVEIEIYEDEAGGFRWRLEGGDGKVKADSGRYADRDAAEQAATRVRTFLPDADLIDIGEAAFEIYEDEAGEDRWRLRHKNGNILADGGEGYSDRSGVWDGIESVKRNAPDAVVDETLD